MACMSIPCVGLNCSRLNNVGDSPNQNNARSCSLPIFNHINPKQRGGGISMTSAAAAGTMMPITAKNSGLHLKPYEKLKGISGDDDDKIDEWMRESVMEIVRNLREAPLLVQVFSKKNGSTKVKTEKAAVDDWEIIKGKWKDGNTPLPEGVILVEELKERKEDDDDEDDSESEITKAWGLVIQEKGVERGAPACYLLKTSRVRSGLGTCCTHFCLARVTSFRDTTESQLTNCWLFK